MIITITLKFIYFPTFFGKKKRLNELTHWSDKIPTHQISQKHAFTKADTRNHPQIYPKATRQIDIESKTTKMGTNTTQTSHLTTNQ